MNPMQTMRDPAAGVNQQLLPHFHLISKNRYPVTNNPSLETIVGYLLEAPKVVRELPMQWQMLDAPQDGTLMLTWQPEPYLGTNFASDGYIWGDQETTFNSEVRGYTLQMFMHRSGFRPQIEAMASHSRRRYRLLPTQQSMGGPMPDPNIWLIHYSKAAPRDHVPAVSFGMNPAFQAQLNQRRVISQHGAVVRKEFLLHDRANWPVINLPGMRQPSTAQAPPAGHRRGPSVGMPEMTVEEEEDVSRGDALDFMTPRDVSRMRYEQHHEWMEEILESPYRTMQIIPPELGLGRKGELESLTNTFFDAPTAVLQETPATSQPARVGKMDSGKADEFTKLATQRLADMQADLDRMKKKHEKRMDKLRKTTVLANAEKRIRSAPLEASRKNGVKGAHEAVQNGADPLDDIAKEMEELTGKSIERLHAINRVSKGGFQEAQVPTLSNTATSQPVTSPVKTSAIPNTTPQTQPAPQHPQQTATQQNVAPIQQSNSNITPGTTTPASQTSAPSNTMKQETQQDNDTPADEDVGDDMEMTGLDGAQDTDLNMDMDGADDWVMVGDQNQSTAPAAGQSEGEDAQKSSEQTPVNTGFTPTDGDPQPTADPSHEQSQQPTTGQGQEIQLETPQETGETPIDFDMGNDFDDVNTAGDALADYGAGDDDLNLDNLDSFGDAFHHNQNDHDLA